MTAGVRAFETSSGREHAPTGKTAADALRDRHDVGLDARPLVGEQLAGAADASLHSSTIRSRPCSLANSSHARKKLASGTRTPPSPWTGSIMIAAVSGR